MSTSIDPQSDYALIGKANDRGWIADPDRVAEIAPALDVARKRSRWATAVHCVTEITTFVFGVNIFNLLTAGAYGEAAGTFAIAIAVITLLAIYSSRLDADERLYFIGRSPDGLFIDAGQLGALATVEATDRGRWNAATVLADLEEVLDADATERTMSPREVEDLVRFQTERALDELFDRSR